MGKENKTSRKRGKGGRPQEDDPATNCIMVRFNNVENAHFLTLFEQPECTQGAFYQSPGVRSNNLCGVIIYAK
jgi:hypothetical protein